MSAVRSKPIIDAELDSNRDSVTLVGQMLSSAFCESELPEDVRFDVRLAAQEAIVNAVEHGNHCDERKKIRIRCDVKDGSVIVVVRDEGDGFDPVTVPDPTLPENVLKEHGRGIFLMRNLCDEVRYSPQGNEVTLIKKFQENRDR